MPSKAQEGDFILNHFKPRGIEVDMVHFDILQDPNGMMYFANRRGVLRFDGYLWELIPTQGAVFSLAMGNNQEVVTLGADGVGFIKKDYRGKYLYEHLDLPAKIESSIQKIQVDEEKLWILADSALFYFDLQAQELRDTQVSTASDYILNVFKTSDRSYLQLKQKGLYEFDGEKLGRQIIGFSKSEELIYMGNAKADQQKIAVSNEGRIYRLDGNRLHRLVFNSDLELEEMQMMQAKWLDEEILAISTLRHGILLINPYQVKIVKWINYTNGLPDNEIFAIATDSDKGLWMAHEFGFSRLAINLPLRTFSHYPGLAGNLLDVESHNGKIYVATSLGVYYLSEVKTYVNTVYYERKKTAKKVASKKVKSEEPKIEDSVSEVVENSKQETESEESGKKGLFSFLKKNKNKAKEAEPEKVETTEKQGVIAKLFGGGSNEDDSPMIKPDEKPETVLERKVRRELQSISYVYKPIQGLSAKVKQLFSTGEMLLAATHSGIYEINDSTSQLIHNSPVRTIYYDQKSKKLYASTLFDELIVLQKSGNIWLRLPNLPIKEAISYIFKDKKEVVWFTGKNNIYNYANGQGEGIFGTFPVENPYYLPIGTIFHGDKLVFLINNQYWSFEEKINSLQRRKDLESLYGLYNHFFQQEADFVWLKDSKSWNLAGNSPFSDIHLEYLSLFKNINCIVYDPEEKLIWVIDEEKTLYRFDIQKSSPFLSSSKLFLREVRDQEGKALASKNLTISQLDSYLQFEFSQPDFLGMLGVEYSYYLEGLSKEWSDWSSSNIISFQYLPPGNYKLNVKTRNNFGQIQERDVLEFSVNPPFWQTWWFYALEVAFFSMLLLASIRINNTTKWKDSIISRVLGFFTLVLVVESLQALGGSFFENESLVIEFVINIAIAFLILPIEGLLRKYIIDKEIDDAIHKASPQKVKP